MAKTILKTRYFCGSCIVGCGRIVSIDHGKYAGVNGAGPEYETMALLGSNTLVDDLEAVAKAHELCNRYGLDVISTGAVIGFALEAAEAALNRWLRRLRNAKRSLPRRRSASPS
jgi:aldehyde:ferredoxin oxidoreductase